jgi:hypothetical protein
MQAQRGQLLQLAGGWRFFLLGFGLFFISTPSQSNHIWMVAGLDSG